MKIKIDLSPDEMGQLLRRADEPRALTDSVRQLVHGEMSNFLRDVEFRVAQAYDVQHRVSEPAPARKPHRLRAVAGKVYAEDLAISRHLLTGYTVTNNSPITGSIAWASLHVVYNGTDYALTDANTALRYAWFAPATSTTIVQVSNTKPALLATDCLLFINIAGVASVAVDAAIPVVVADAAIDAGALATGAVTSNAIAALAVTSGAIAAGAVINGKLGASAVDATAIATGAVTTAKFLAGAVDAAALAANAVTSAKIATGAVTSTAIATGAVLAAGLGAGAVTSTAIATGAVLAAGLGAGAVGSVAIANNAVGSTQLANGAVGATQLGTAAVTAAKLNLLSHMLY